MSFSIIKLPDIKANNIFGPNEFIILPVKYAVNINNTTDVNIIKLKYVLFFRKFNNDLIDIKI